MNGQGALCLSQGKIQVPGERTGRANFEVASETEHPIPSGRHILRVKLSIAIGCSKIFESTPPEIEQCHSITASERCQKCYLLCPLETKLSIAVK